MLPSVFRTKNNRSRRFIFGETGHRTLIMDSVEYNTVYSDSSPSEKFGMKMQIFIFCYQVRSRSRGDLDLTCGGHVAYHLMQLDERNISAPTLIYKQKHMLTLSRHYMTSNSLSRGHICKKSGLRFQRYKPLKSVTTAGRPLILRFLVYTSKTPCLAMNERARKR